MVGSLQRTHEELGGGVGRQSSVDRRAHHGQAPVSINEIARIYTYERFSGRSPPEKELLVELAVSLVDKLGIDRTAPLNIVDYGCGDGWFSRTLAERHIVNPQSSHFLYDLSCDMRENAERLSSGYRNIDISADPLELQDKLAVVGYADVLFLNMVDLCQPSISDVENLFREAAGCLKPRGVVIMTTQNPLARPGQFANYSTEFRFPNQDVTSENAQLVTRVAGVSGELIDFHRPIQSTLGSMNIERLKPVHIATMDDAGQINDCNLSALAPQENGTRNAKHLWVPALTISRNFLLVSLDRRADIRNFETPSSESPIRLDKNAPYMGVAAVYN